MVRVQHEPHQDVPQGYADYFELKAILASGSRGSSPFSLNYLKDFELEAVPMRWSEITFFDTFTGQGKLVFMNCLPLWSPAVAFCSPQGALLRGLTSSLAQGVCYTSTPLFTSERLTYPGSLDPSCMWGSHVHDIKCDFLLSICLLLIYYLASQKQPEEGNGNFSLPHIILCELLLFLQMCWNYLNSMFIDSLRVTNEASKVT